MNRNTNKFSSETMISIFFSKFLKINWVIIFCLIFLGLVGVASLYSAAGSDWNPWAKNHLIRLIFGFCLMFVIAFIPSKFFFKYSVLSFFIGISALILVRFIGSGSVQRWISYGGINFQPSEIMKLSLILILAKYFDHISKIQLEKLSPYIIPIFILSLIHI